MSSTPGWLWEVVTDGDWRGQDVVVVGGGPSLAQVDLEAIEEATAAGAIKCIVTNQRAFKVPSGLAFSIDAGWVRREGHPPNEIKCFGVPEGIWNLRPEGWYCVKRVTPRRSDRTRYPWPSSIKDFVLGANSGACGLALADCLTQGKGTIYLVGFDMAPGPEHKGREKTYEQWRDQIDERFDEVRSKVYVVGDSALSKRWERSTRWMVEAAA